MTLHVQPDGRVTCVHDDALDGVLAELGATTLRRASHVEPVFGIPGEWAADLSPVGGPTLGMFPTRREALAAEVEWLDQHPEAHARV